MHPNIVEKKLFFVLNDGQGRGAQWVVYVEQGGVDFIIELRHQNTFYFVTDHNIMLNNDLGYDLSSLVTCIL